MKRDETHLIQRILNGETALFEQFIHNYGQQIFLLTVRIVGNREDAEELVQDTFMKAFSSLNRFGGKCAFSTWIYSIAYNTAISHTRRQRFDTLTMDDAQLAALSDQEVDDTLNDDSDRQTERLSRAIGRLAPDEQALISLHYYEGHPLKEIATILGMSESNTRTKLHRVRKKICLLMKTEES